MFRSFKSMTSSLSSLIIYNRMIWSAISSGIQGSSSIIFPSDSSIIALLSIFCIIAVFASAIIPVKFHNYRCNFIYTCFIYFSLSEIFIGFKIFSEPTPAIILAKERDINLHLKLLLQLNLLLKSRCSGITFVISNPKEDVIFTSPINLFFN